MTRWVLVAGVLIAVFLISRVIAIGRKAPRTLTEQKAALFGGRPARFRRRHDADIEQLDMTPKKLAIVRCA